MLTLPNTVKKQRYVLRNYLVPRTNNKKLKTGKGFVYRKYLRGNQVQIERQNSSKPINGTQKNNEKKTESKAKNKKRIRKMFDNFIKIISVLCTILSLFLSWEAIRVSEIAFQVASNGTEPIIDLDIEYWNDKITIRNKSHKYYQINNVNYGEIIFIGIMDDDSYFNHVYIPGANTSITLEHGHTTGTDMPDKYIKKYNKKLMLELRDEDTIEKCPARIEFNNELQRDIIERCETQGYHYWGVSHNYTYHYIEINYKDAHGTRDSMYYIYKYEYGSTWQLYKLEKDKYYDYMSQVYAEGVNKEDIISYLLDRENFELINNTEFIDYYYMYRPLYEKIGKGA